jgi:hypothetical protein
MLSIGADLRSAYQLILMFFGSIENYLTKRETSISVKEVEKIIIEDNLPEIEDIYGIYHCKWINADRRKLTVEVHTDSELSLTSNNLAGILIPMEFHVNKAFQQVCKETEAKMIFYCEINSLINDDYYNKITLTSINLTLKNAS